MGTRGGGTSRLVEEAVGEKKGLGGGRLTQAELLERSRRGLCFKCGETWGKDHVSKFKHY